MAEGSEAMIEAAGEGSLRPRDPARLQVRDADVEAWVAELTKLDPEGELMPLVKDEAALAAAAPLQQCRATQLILRAVRALPEERQVNLMAFILAAGLQK